MVQRVLLVSEQNGISPVLIHVLLLNAIREHVSKAYVNVFQDTKAIYVTLTSTIVLEILVVMETV